MKVYLKLYATLRQYVPNAAEIARKEGWEVSEGTTARDVLEMVDFPDGLKVLALVNGAHCRDMAAVLKDGDTLLLYPMMSGG
ncbi:MAG: MoaD/ThiS family protein [Thermodesulfobacteriota bacterium]